MASSLSSPSTATCGKRRYDVFLSFRGKDTRDNFISHLHAALRRQNIATCVDNGYKRREEIWPVLLKGIEESKLSVVVFSRNYVSSKWCLDELVNILECNKSKGQIVVPIFYRVDPSDVRKQTGRFGEAFAKHKEWSGFEVEQVERWRAALMEAANLPGWVSDNKRPDSVLVDDIVRYILKKLNQISSPDIEGLVGIDLHLEQINSLLCLELLDVRTVGIWGMGGIGKTTIARAVFEQISSQFDGCCFLANVREESKKYGLVRLQEQVISKLLEIGHLRIGNTNLGRALLKRRLHHKKVLLVLDDVDDLEQLELLGGAHDWFGMGSRIIVTTRDKHVLQSEVDAIYAVGGLNYDKSLQLFCQYAFQHNHPTEDYVELSNKVIDYANGNPLALKVLGSFLCGKSKQEWENSLSKVEGTINKQIQSVLRSSYDGLDEVEKDIFLDIACFFKGENVDHVMEILDSCGFYPNIGILVLIDRSLVTISHGRLDMHDLLQEMGREIVRQEFIHEPGRRSRLWNHEDIYHVLMKNMGTEAVEGISLDMCKISEVWLNPAAFARMANLRLLKLYDSNSEKNCKVHLPGGLESLSDELRYLHWHQCPLNSLPSDFNPENLVELNLPHSNIKELWKGKKLLRKLKFVNLSHSQKLTRTPDFTGIPNLKKLALEDCTNLTEIHPSAGVLKRLRVLNLKDCKCLRGFPAIIEMESLEELILSGCTKLVNFPELVGKMGCLSKLCLDGTAIKELPSSIGHLTGLAFLNLKDCRNLIRLPRSIHVLKSLKILNLSGCSKLENMPENLGHVKALEELNISGTAIRQLPSSIVLLENLKVLSFQGCKSPASNSWRSFLSVPFRLSGKKGPDSDPDPNPMTPVFPSLLGLRFLKDLDLSDCNLRKEAIPNDLGSLSSLTRLNLSSNNFVSLPASLSQLSKLAFLDLENCKSLQSLPELPSGMEIVIVDACSSLKALSYPSQLHSIPAASFHAFDCFKLVENQGRNSIAFLLMKRYLQGVSNLKPRFDFTVPGSEIPDWFSHKHEGPSVTIHWPPPAHDDSSWMGYALCAVFIVHDHPTIYYDVPIRCHLVADECHQGSTLYRPFRIKYGLIESDHLWLFYLPRHAWDATSWQNKCSRIEFSFESNCPGVKVKKCGARIVYQQDVEEFDQRANQCNTFSFENLGDLHQDLDESAVNGVIIKLIDDDCSDLVGAISDEEEPQPKRIKN